MRKFAIRAALFLSILTLGLWVTRGIWTGRMRDVLFEYALVNLPPQEREALYDRLASHTGTLWDAVPEPQVGWLAKRQIVVEHTGTEVHTNRAGMRSRRQYKRKAAGDFRIVCLGDSFVMGMGGPEEDRFADQLGVFYREHDTRVDGKQVEVLAVGLAGWTAVQQATYLTSRLSDYDPDVILVLTVPNDITTNLGITGLGAFTTMFSPEERHLGSGTFSNQAALRFGTSDYSALAQALSPASRAAWDKAIRALDRLVRLQHERGGNILLAVLNWPVGTGQHAKLGRFTALYNHHVHEAGITAPWIVTSYFPAEETQLPHDAHPNRYGHSLLAHHFVHAFEELGWVENADGALPDLHPDLSLELSPRVPPERLAEVRREYVELCLRTHLDFENVTPDGARAFLGGILPDFGGPKKEAGPGAPWASVCTGFLLQRGDDSASTVTVNIEVPAFPELFPLRVVAAIDGTATEVLSLANAEEAGKHTLRAPIPNSHPGALAIEIVLTTESYFTTILDPRMKSYRLLSAGVE